MRQEKNFKHDGLVAVTFDEGVRPCVMQKHTYEAKLESRQFDRHET